LQILATEAEVTWRFRWVTHVYESLARVLSGPGASESRRVALARPQSTRAYIYNMDSIQSTAGPTIESQPEPKPIRRLQDEVINRIAAGEVSPFRSAISRFPLVRALTRFFLSFLPALRSYIAQLLPSRSCLKTVWMRALLPFVSPSGTGV
jgi:hypothetical protein